MGAGGPWPGWVERRELLGTGGKWLSWGGVSGPALLRSLRSLVGIPFSLPRLGLEGRKLLEAMISIGCAALP